MPAASKTSAGLRPHATVSRTGWPWVLCDLVAHVFAILPDVQHHSLWGFFVVTSLSHLNQGLKNAYVSRRLFRPIDPAVHTHVLAGCPRYRPRRRERRLDQPGENVQQHRGPRSGSQTAPVGSCHLLGHRRSIYPAHERDISHAGFGARKLENHSDVGEYRRRRRFERDGSYLLPTHVSPPRHRAVSMPSVADPPPSGSELAVKAGALGEYITAFAMNARQGLETYTQNLFQGNGNDLMCV